MERLCDNCQFEIRCGCKNDDHQYKMEQCQHYAALVELQEYKTIGTPKELSQLKRSFDITAEENEIIEEEIIRRIYEDGQFPLTLADKVSKILYVSKPVKESETE